MNRAEDGFLRRVVAPRVADFFVGLLWGQTKPSAFAGSVGRPPLNENIATDFSAWPGRTADYDRDGNLAHPERALFGQNVLVGIALTFAEVRAFLAGLTQPADVGRELAAQYFRVGRGLALVLAELGVSGGLPQSAYTDAFWRLFFGPSVRAVSDSDVPNDGRLYVAKRLPSGRVALALGDEEDDGDDVIGVFARPVNKGGFAVVVGAGGFIAKAGLQPGKLYRAADASLRPYAELVDEKYTTFIGIGSALGLDVRAIQGEQVDNA